MSPIAATMALHRMPAGRKGVVALLNCGQDAAVRAQAMGLRAGKSIEVLGRSGRLLLIQVGATRLAISDDLAQHVEVR
jgi:Fe2+ transport system protein FeoA